MKFTWVPWGKPSCRRPCTTRCHQRRRQEEWSCWRDYPSFHVRAPCQWSMVIFMKQNKANIAILQYWWISPQSVVQVEGPLLLLDQLVLGRDVLAKRVFPEVAAQVLQCWFGAKICWELLLLLLYLGFCFCCCIYWLSYLCNSFIYQGTCRVARAVVENALDAIRRHWPARRDILSEIIQINKEFHCWSFVIIHGIKTK